MKITENALNKLGHLKLGVPLNGRPTASTLRTIIQKYLIETKQ